MAQQQHAPGGHYSGHNPIPTISQFIENLDKDKKSRDQNLEELNKPSTTSDAHPHVPTKGGVEGTQKLVTDPTTGNKVIIEDVNKDTVKMAENPQLTVPNANLGKETVNILRATWPYDSC